MAGFGVSTGGVGDSFTADVETGGGDDGGNEFGGVVSIGAADLAANMSGPGVAFVAAAELGTDGPSALTTGSKGELTVALAFVTASAAPVRRGTSRTTISRSSPTLGLFERTYSRI